ncbi:MAG: Re/Si-specific NAD(P)(+) transhydrogenase subunit alpha [Phycisphaerae bacterium]
MKLAVPREIQVGERRVALTPDSCKRLTKLGVQVAIERGAGESAYLPDEAYQSAGATVERDVAALLGAADFVVKVQPPMQHPSLARHEAELLKSGAFLLTTLAPTRNLEAVQKLMQRGVTALSTDLIPRITRAQSMDTLSSMANIAGYRAVLIAALELPKYFPMFMTAAGTVLAAKVFVIGAGVAGLQAIATAKRLGAIVEATDTRPAVREQIESLGGRWVGVETAESAQDAGGYAKELSADFYRKQAELIGQRCAANDAVITTALIGGIKAPRLITADMVHGMKPGSIIVDVAAERGGNCELTQPGKTIEVNGVKICGPANLPADMPLHASTLYSKNIETLIAAFTKDGVFAFNLEDEILKGCTVTHQGAILHVPTREAFNADVKT